MTQGDANALIPPGEQNGRNLEAAENGQNPEAADQALILQPRRDDGAYPEAGKDRREQIRHLEKEAFQLANYYFVFQGVIFTAFYHAPSRIKCDYKWVPLALSAIAGVLNSCALFRIAMTYKRTLDDGDKGSGGGDSVATMCDRCWRCCYVVVCMIFILAFLVVTLVGCWVITCDGGDEPSPAAPPG